MGRFGLAWKILTSSAWADKITSLLTESATPKLPVTPEPPRVEKPVPPPKPARSDAITLLATLQREARLIDFLKEPIDAYSDAQIGAAVRDIHRDSAAVLERQFAIRPLTDAAEGASVPVPQPLDPGLTKLSGPGASGTPTAGKLVHHGWTATRCELPTWTGTKPSANVIGPTEIEV
ncbi:MAG: DUF2760 domain-containing protein [Planctomycetaceae bacterium]|nr:DUF2760 domain-containing protein [Planctomycetaceae bacterium]